MISGIGALASQVMDLLFAEALLSSVIAAVVLIVCSALGGRRRALQKALWGLVLLRLILPPGLAHPLGAGTLLARAGFVGEGISIGEAPDAAAGVPSGSSGKAAEEPPGADVILAGLWLCGTTALLVLDTVRRRAVRRILAAATPVTDVLALGLAERWRRRLRIHRDVRLVTADRLVSPFTDGILRPVIFLPSSLLRPRHRPALAAALGHELAHVARWDVLQMRIERALGRIYFFHPVAWLARRRLHSLRESLSDALATSRGLVPPRLYVRGLLDVLQLDLQGVEAPSLTLSQRRILMRLQSVLTTHHRTRRSWRAPLTAASIGFFVLPLGSAPAATHASGNAPAVSTQTPLADPLPSGKVTRRFGKSMNPFGKGEETHEGIDLAAPAGTPVLSAGAGTVELATTTYEPAPTAGTVVVIDHGGNRKTFYSHLSRLDVKVGQRVSPRQPLGAVGNTGTSTGPHLHLEVWEGDAHVDPALAIPALSRR